MTIFLCILAYILIPILFCVIRYQLILPKYYKLAFAKYHEAIKKDRRWDDYRERSFAIMKAKEAASLFDYNKLSNRTSNDTSWNVGLVCAWPIGILILLIMHLIAFFLERLEKASNKQANKYFDKMKEKQDDIDIQERIIELTRQGINHDDKRVVSLLKQLEPCSA